MTQVLLVGNPNSGKTTLFNALTGDNQRVGNWPGVTVEKKTGVYHFEHQDVHVTDLPGTYSLVSNQEGTSQDTKITSLEVVKNDADMIVNVVNACHLERHLYLSSQLLELGKPFVLALNMMDIAKQRGISIQVAALSDYLGCPVIQLEAHRQVGLGDLKKAIHSKAAVGKSLPLSLPLPLQDVLTEVGKQLTGRVSLQLRQYYACRIVEGDSLLMPALTHVDAIDDADIVMADARYQAIHSLMKQIQHKQSDAREFLTAKIDRIVLHRFWALPIFFAVMYCMFLVAINIGGAFQDFFDITTDTLFIQGSAWLLQQCHAPNWLVALCANGIGKGINTTLTFVPVMAGMYFFLSFLEASGYMARAAFVVDKVMRVLGLPGKAFVPMIVGFGCNVPAIMAARTLDSERDRLMTVLMSPFMSCSARLAIYAVFVAAFFPEGGQNVVFSLYLIGIVFAVVTGVLLRNTLLKGAPSPLILELPAYHRPSIRRLLKDTQLRLRYFILRAGKLIIPVCVVLGGLNALTMDGGLNTGAASSESVLSVIGQWIVPFFSPMGLHQENWPAAVGLLTGMLAKEVVIGSLNSLYTHVNLEQINMVHVDFWNALQAALWSIPENLAAVGQTLLHPFVPASPEMNASTYGVFYQHFDGKIGAYAYLLFISLYIPCISTMAAIRQEANRSLMWFSIVWSTAIAYAIAVVFYQLATVNMHPLQTILWIIAIALFMILLVKSLHTLAKQSGDGHAIAAS